MSLGFADPSKVDLDSTVQEANIAYPADANLMTKLAGIGKKVIDYLREKTRGFLPKDVAVDMKAIKAKARSYFFLAKNTNISKKRAFFTDLHRIVKRQMRPVVEVCKKLDAARLVRLPWNIRRAVNQVNTRAWRYLLDVAHFTRTHTLKAGKILSLHAQEVACITKGKAGKQREFGRVFQLGRIDGGFLFVLSSESVRMNDKQSLLPLVGEHALLFGHDVLKSLAADKGYWSQKNLSGLSDLGVSEIGLQYPSNLKCKTGLPSQEIQELLRNRRAGIEALIGRTKQGGQLASGARSTRSYPDERSEEGSRRKYLDRPDPERSRMKSDTATLAAGYGSVLGFNLRQLPAQTKRGKTERCIRQRTGLDEQNTKTKQIS